MAPPGNYLLPLGGGPSTRAPDSVRPPPAGPSQPPNSMGGVTPSPPSMLDYLSFGLALTIFFPGQPPD